MIRHVINFVLILFPPSRCFQIRSFILRCANVKIARSVSVCGGGWIYGRGALEIGHSTWLSPRVLFYTHIKAPIILGANCDIGPGVTFVTGSHIIGGRKRRAGFGTANPITVGEGCWIGANSIILGGVSIAPGSVIAAGSVVTESVPSNVLVAGVPARFKKKLIE